MRNEEGFEDLLGWLDELKKLEYQIVEADDPEVFEVFEVLEGQEVTEDQVLEGEELFRVIKVENGVFVEIDEDRTI